MLEDLAGEEWNMSADCRDFLRQQAEKYQAEIAEGKADFEDWRAAVERLFAQMRAWLKDDDVLFSVFESQVRDYLVARIKPEAAGLTDPILREAAGDAIQGVEEGSFYRRVLHPLNEQGRVSADIESEQMEREESDEPLD
jgi:hypothetical protein